MTGPIWKQEVHAGTFSVGGRVIHVAEQYGRPNVWYVADGRHRVYQIVTTGNEPPEGWHHVGTFLADMGAFVGHLFCEEAP